MTSKDEVLKLALHALEFDGFTPNDATHCSYHAKAITAIKEALAEQPAQKRPQNCGTGYCSCIECVMKPEQPAQQQPVAWISEVRCVGPEYGKKRYGALPIQSLQPGYYVHTPLYASPQPSKPWVGLTEEKVSKLVSCIRWRSDESIHTYAVRACRATQDKLKELNT